MYVYVFTYLFSTLQPQTQKIFSLLPEIGKASFLNRKATSRHVSREDVKGIDWQTCGGWYRQNFYERILNTPDRWRRDYIINLAHKRTRGKFLSVEMIILWRQRRNVFYGDTCVLSVIHASLQGGLISLSRRGTKCIIKKRLAWTLCCWSDIANKFWTIQVRYARAHHTY